MYGINTIINCGIWQPVKFQSVSRFLNWIKNELIFLSYLWINELMLPNFQISQNGRNHHNWPENIFCSPEKEILNLKLE